VKFESQASELLFELLRWRRDVRHFLVDPIPDEIITRLKDAWELAPSVGNSRPWRVIRVDDHKLRDGVRTIFNESNAKAAEIYDGHRADQYRALKLAGLDTAPLQLAVFIDCEPKQGCGLGRQTVPETLQQSVAMAIHTLWLAARSQNLGLGMLSILEPERVEDLFEVPETWRFSAYLCLGWPQFDDDTPLLHRAGWQANEPSPWIEDTGGSVPSNHRANAKRPATSR
jgi:5,6-dimethylbenzimidazole synthase